MGDVLVVNNIEVIYDHVILVLKGVSLRVPEGGIVALLGANGAGKSTTLKAISGLLRTERGEVTKGSIELLGAPARQRRLHFRGRAADAGDRPRPHGPSPGHAARRAVHGAGAHAGGGDLRDRGA